MSIQWPLSVVHRGVYCLGLQDGADTMIADMAVATAHDLIEIANRANGLALLTAEMARLRAALQTAEALLTQYAIRLSDDGEMTVAILNDMRQVRDALTRAEGDDELAVG